MSGTEDWEEEQKENLVDAACLPGLQVPKWFSVFATQRNTKQNMEGDNILPKEEVPQIYDPRKNHVFVNFGGILGVGPC